MPAEDIAALRPTADDSASIEAAIERATAAQAVARATAGDAMARRKAMLLTASDAALDRVERDAAEATRRADRIEALLAELRPMHRAALQREYTRRLRDAVVASRAREQAWLERWTAEYPKHAGAIRDLLLEERELDSSADRVTELYHEGRSQGFDTSLDIQPADARATRAYYFGGLGIVPGDFIQLPSASVRFQGGEFHVPRNGKAPRSYRP